MIVTTANFHEVLNRLKLELVLALDVETTGLKPYHADKLFSLILATPEEAWYFNFQDYKFDTPVLPRTYLKDIFLALDAPSMTWGGHNLKFDLAFLFREGIELQGDVWCTKAMARVERNDHFKYSLVDCLERMDGKWKKSDKVKEYIDKHNLKTKRPIPGKKTEEVLLHFDQVPFEVIVPYGEADGLGTAALHRYQQTRFMSLDEQEPVQVALGRSLKTVVNNECRLTKTVFEMERVGVKIDRDFCKRAIEFEGARLEKACDEFKRLTGEKFAASAKLFERVFESDKDKWQLTEKGNPSFESDILNNFSSPAARCVLEARDSKSKSDFYNGFLFHADGDDVIHPSLIPEGTVHGRFSSSNPNFQNLKADDDEASAGEFIVRRAVIPRPGYKLVSIDYDTMEYKFALELACKIAGHETELAKLINSGVDFHQGTADLVKKVAKKEITRKIAKISNFLTLYGGGNAKLAAALNCPLAEAKTIRMAIIHAAPEIDKFIKACVRSAEAKGFVTNWLGRRSWFSDSRFSYRAPNYIVSGGCADVVKVAMNEIHEFLRDKKSRMIMCVHDELVFELAEGEENIVQYLVKLMTESYKSKYVWMTCSVSESTKSLGDLCPV